MSFWDNISGLAPTLIAALTGNIPAAAASAAAFIAKQFGWTNSDPEAVKQQLSALTPDQLIKLKQLEVDYVNAENAKVDMLLGDIQDARAMRTELAADGQKEYTPTILSYISVLGFWSTFYALFFVKIPPDAKSIIILLLGTLLAENKQVYNYWFGTTISSFNKSKFIC